MKNSTFHVLICKAKPELLKHFARISKNLTRRQRDRIMKVVGGAA
ncbi:hypothetical protein QE177_15105 (plasmid) [Arsenophonus sp. aPb]|nr:hypothetical protein [Arsenophonus sp. aPb]WGL99827.1 hypothetical protein QE177_15105 [Arsenophonus sp. aPb]